MSPFFMFCFLLFQGRFCGDHFIIEHTPALLQLYKNHKASKGPDGGMVDSF
jgi:hypothetical protein